jgi:UDP-glucose 4-epimerase
MLQAYAEYFGIRSIIFRFVSWIGPRYSHGVVFDFVKKLRANPRKLEILGDGKQMKSYLDVRDGVSGIFCAVDRFQGNKGVFNLGHDAFLNVLDLARIVTSELGLEGVEFLTTGGERGWLGDSPVVHLDTSRIKELGWSPHISIEEGIRATTRFLMENPRLLEKRNQYGSATIADSRGRPWNPPQIRTRRPAEADGRYLRQTSFAAPDRGGHPPRILSHRAFDQLPFGDH